MRSLDTDRSGEEEESKVNGENKNTSSGAHVSNGQIVMASMQI